MNRNINMNVKDEGEFKVKSKRNAVTFYMAGWLSVWQYVVHYAKKEEGRI